MWVVVPERAPSALQRLAVQTLRFLVLPLGIEQQGHVVDGVQGLRMIVAEYAPLAFERVANIRLGLFVLTLELQ